MLDGTLRKIASRAGMEKKPAVKSGLESIS
jgi:hypothetical protein